MTKISTNQFKNGLKIILNGAPCSILDHEFHKPGKGQAVMRVKYRNLLTGKVIDKTFKSGESVDQADVIAKEMTYLYSMVRIGTSWIKRASIKLASMKTLCLMQNNG